MSDTDVLQYLQSKGMHLKNAGGWEVHTACIFCEEDTAKRGRLYINTDPQAEIPGLYMCHRCGAKGSLSSIKRFYGDTVKQEDVDHERQGEILRIAAAFYHELLGDHSEVFEYLRGPERGLTTDTIIEHQIGYAPINLEHDVATGETYQIPSRDLYRHLRGQGFVAKEILASGLAREHEKGIVDSLSGMVTIPYHVAGNVVQIRGRAWPYHKDDKRPKYKTCGGNEARLFNSDVTWEREDVVLCEGEFDALVMTQLGFPAVGVPGAKQWKEGWNGYIANLKRVWLLYDRDQEGETAAEKIVAKFGPKVRRVHLSPKGMKCDPTTWVNGDPERVPEIPPHTAEDFQALLDRLRIGGLLKTVDQAISQFSDVQGQPGIKFNHELLDLMIEPGLQKSQVLVMLAKTGTGKTIWCLNQMQRMRMVPGQEDLKFLFLSLEQTAGEWWDRARRIHRFYNLDSTDVDCRDWWADNIMLADQNRMTVDEIRQTFDDFDYRFGRLPDVVFLDYIGYLAQGFRGERYDRVSDAVMSLKGLGKEYELPWIAPHQVNRSGRDGEEFGSDASRDSGVIEETADFLFTLWTPDNALMKQEEEKTGEINMRIGKSRHGGRGVMLTYQWAPLSLVMVPRGDRHTAMARKEFEWRRQYKDNWDKAVYRHRTGFDGVFKSERVPDVVTQSSWTDDSEAERF